MTAGVLPFSAQIAAAAFQWTDVPWARGVCALVAFGVVCCIAYTKMFPDRNAPLGVLVAFNATVAVSGGAALIVGLSEKWPALLLVAGACLGVGFLFGLIFGYPLSPPRPQNGQGPPPASATTTTTPAPGATATTPAPTTTPVPTTTPASAPASASVSASIPMAAFAGGMTVPRQTLLQQTADSLSKVVAGASLAGLPQLYGQFLNVSQAVTQIATSNESVHNYTYGAALISYFLILGFLTGLLLPNYYHLLGTTDGTEKK